MGSTIATRAIAERSVAVPTDASVEIVFCFDHEEVGSRSYQGAEGTLANDTFERIFWGLFPGGKKTVESVELFKTCIKRSMLVSADNGHATHPNYADREQTNHRCAMQQGIIIGIDANQGMTTDCQTNSIVHEICDLAKVPYQEQIDIAGTSGGSTIGPPISANIGMMTCDIGTAQLAMHSIREFGGVVDTLYYKNFFKQFFTSFTEVRGSLFQD